MECMKTIRGFHWITKTVMALTILLIAMIMVVAIVQMYAMSNQNDQAAFNAGQGLGAMTLALAGILPQVFLLILIIMVVYMAVTRIRTWIEKYLDAMLAKLDTLAEQKAGREDAGAQLAIMNGKVDGMEKKLEKIERILENVAE
ncbi:hypothetical protein [Methanoregula sp.]|uniref:hypothetical protein n=1 Tax=Methanoregula sp. TaxID=2052170 RepID=UPI003564F247